MSAVGVVLPDELAYVLDLIGVAWPNVDEDDYREMATSLRDFADDIDGGAMDAHSAVQELLGANAGAAMDAFEAHWGKVRGTHLANLAEAARMGAVALDGVAIAIEVAKGAAIIQLGILAVEIAATIASAPITLGLSSFAGAAATQATRMIVKKIFREVINQVVDQLMSLATAPIYAALESMAADLVIQVGSNALGLQKGVDLRRTADAGKEGFGEGVDGAKKQADSFTLASAGGGGGGGGGTSGGGSDHFQSDEDSFARVDTRLDGITGSMRGRSRGHMGRARNAKGRTGGRGEIAEHIMPIATKIVDGIGEAAEKAVGHMRNDMRKGLKQMHANHRDNDEKIADQLKGISKSHGRPSSPAAGYSTGSGSGSGGSGGPSGGGPKGPGGGGPGQGIGGPSGVPLNPQPGWHGKSAGKMKCHRRDAVDVSHLSPEDRIKVLEDEAGSLADDANDSALPAHNQVGGNDYIKTGCAGSLLHDGVVTSHTSATGRHGQKVPEAHPVLQQVYDDIKAESDASDRPFTGAGHGKCAEVALISDRLHQLDPTGRSIRTVDDARDALAGSIIHSRQIGNLTDKDGNVEMAHGEYKPPCRSCARALPILGVHAHQ
ncbi:YwqJ-related putative deaminase [Actinacidiphila glaucinigra]|uniref:YwqJ-related putative deaminase n=1 Tax=Actinacidiphila glaucinigra TaxID=235986 RepID=UPI002DDA46B6|nr:YwqJ-related putative deaminase [Actinacidiphila glaucinigra]WSD61968.1 YwqJ-related putative deaminase [Actinacidiphila glaucinigra]